MLQRLRGFLAPPVFPDDEDKTRQARVLYFLLASVMATVFFLAAVAIPLLYTSKLEDYLLILPLAIFLAVAYGLMRRGRVKTASTIYIVGMWIVFTVTVLSGGGIENELVIFHVAGAVVAGLLLGTAGALIYGGASLLVGLVMLVLQLQGNLPVHNYVLSPVAGLANLTVALILTIAAVSLYTNGLNNALRLTRQRLEALKKAEKNNERQLERLRALQGIEAAMLTSMELEAVLRLLVGEVARQLHVDAVDVLLFRPETQRLEFAAGEGFRTLALRYTNLDLGGGLAGKAAMQGSTVHIADLNEIGDNPALLGAIAGEGFVSYYGVPLISKGSLHGVLELFHRSDFERDPSWLTFLEALAAQAAISIDHARLFDATQQSLKETNTLYHVSQSLAASLDPDQLMHEVVESLHNEFGFYHVQIYEVERGSGALVAAYGSGEIGEQLRAAGYRLAAGSGIAGQAAETGQACTADNVDDVILFVRNPLLPDTQSEMGIPIKIDGQVLGVLDIHQTLPGRLSARQMQLMEAVAEQLAVALQKAHLYRNLQEALQQEKAMRAQLIQNERLALIGRLLASVSHELNNPIQAIQNALYLIKEEEKLSDQGRQDLGIVLTETERMASLIGRLRATYRPTRSEDFEPVQLNQIVDDVRMLTATHMRRQDIRFTRVADPELPLIAGVPDQLRQVVLNLVMNAIEAMPSGGCLTVTTKYIVAEHKVLITFHDTGTGIDPVILPHILEPFISAKQSGTGLGLTITHDIVRQHHGELTADNNADRGATFRVWLPVKREV